MRINKIIVGILLSFSSLSSFAQIKLVLGHGTGLNSPRQVAAMRFAEIVKRDSNNRIEVEVAGAARLGDDAAMVDALLAGTLDMSANSQGAVSAVVPEYNAFGMPFLFANVTQAWKVLDGPLGKELAQKTAAKGMIVLGYWDNGIRQMTNNKKPIRTPADMKQMNIRTPPDQVTIDIMEALGAKAQQIKFSDLYAALQQGIVDGQENPLVNINAGKLYEVQKYISLTNHKYEMTPFLMSKHTWDGLSENDRRILLNAATQATQLQRKLAKEEEEKLLVELKNKGVSINKVQLKPFVDATSGVTEKWFASPIGDFTKRVVKAARAN
ncbi:TRAP transporter substrate-binding protein [Herbaspirillum sp. RV1423]|uniref:TRAP transporter substrate-binding protein n=1 Tax=Herbaspirillum sp. RV1423 TaxID=1443993 RepID=UPI0004ACF81C|nr:TRAP transporter substrate-binding protein [Herbaspirillum sp. RV1423]